MASDQMSVVKPAQAPTGDLDQIAINTIRTLAIDAVEKANSGHAGAPMGLAPVAYTLWTRFLRYDPARPLWPNRDRFVLSNGHASMLLYSLLFLGGVEAVDKQGAPLGRPAVGLDDIKQFRQLDSVCPGHPEHGITTGVETTTGPLGQGVGTSVGMAVAERWLAARYNREGHALIDYNVYAICSDGDLMEGISHEAASLAGHLKLSNLCWIYDDNRITIEGSTELAFTDDVIKRFEGYGWATHSVEDANDCEAFAAAVEQFLATTERPTLIRVRSVIGYGSPHKQGTSKIHSDPLGAEEVKLTKRAYGWPEDAQFLVPDGVKQRFAETLGARGRKLREAWDAASASYAEAFPHLAAALNAMRSGALPGAWDAGIPSFEADAKGIASREASGKVLQTLGPAIPWLVGGAADLSPSTKTVLEAADDGAFEPGSYGGRNFHFGVREHGMAACANGLALAGLRPYVGTFLVFSDYMKPAIRLAALMRLPVTFVFTHDFDRPRPGRPDPSADRAAGRAARHPRRAGAAPRRRQRDGRGLAHDPGAGRPRLPGAVAPGAADARPLALRAGDRGLPRRLRSRRRRGRCAAGDPDRDRQRGLALRRSPGRAGGQRACAPGWCRCPRGSCSKRSRQGIASRCCQRRSRRESRSRPARRRAGTAMWDRRAR